MTDHGAHAAHDPVGAIIVLAALGGLAFGSYLVAVARSRRRGRAWSRWRTVSFAAGAVLPLIAVVPALSPYPGGSFADHMWQHLLIGMVAPVLLVLGAPGTLAVRALSVVGARRLTRALRSRPAVALTRPVVALVLNLGGLAALYFTPLHALTTQSAAVHHLVHVHFFLAGTLFAWVIAGPDPAPHRPSVPARLVVLGVAVAGHAVLSQLLYAGLGAVDAPADDLRAGASLMYFGGDLAELALAFALVASWQPTPGRARVRRPAASTTQEAGGNPREGGPSWT